MALTSVVTPKIVESIGTRTAVDAGMLLGAAAIVLFGVMPDMVPVTSPLLEWGFLITYFFNGLTGALAETAMIILLTLRFQDKLGQVMASVGTVCAIGCMVGPVVGALSSTQRKG